MDAEGVAIRHLSSYGWEVYADVPAERPDEFITVERTGGRLRDVVIDEPTLAVQCWSTSRLSASKMARDVANAMERIVEVPGVNACRVDSIFNFPDYDSGTPRYQLTVELITVVR